MSKTGNARFLLRQLHLRPTAAPAPPLPLRSFPSRDFSFVKAALKDFYVDWGRPLGPVAHVQNVFLQFLLRPLGPEH